MSRSRRLAPVAAARAAPRLNDAVVDPDRHRDHAPLALLLLTCGRDACDRRFFICSHCYRGHRYCSRECSSIARRASAAIARAKYADDAEVKARRLAHARGRYRARRAAELFRADHTSTRTRAPTTVRSARSPQQAGTTPRAEVPHVDRPPSSAPSTSALDLRRPIVGDASLVRCSFCGNLGATLFVGARRFAR